MINIFVYNILRIFTVVILCIQISYGNIKITNLTHDPLIFYNPCMMIRDDSDQDDILIPLGIMINPNENYILYLTNPTNILNSEIISLDFYLPVDNKFLLKIEEIVSNTDVDLYIDHDKDGNYIINPHFSRINHGKIPKIEIIGANGVHSFLEH
jgi:hypothetical protein